MLNDFLEKKKLFFTIITKIFASPINHIFPEGLTHASEQKNIHFLHFLFLIKIRVKII